MKSAILKYIRGINNPKRLERECNRLARLKIEYDAQYRRVMSRSMEVPRIVSWDGSEQLAACVLESRTPWADIPRRESGIPGSISEEEKQYYEYIGRFYSGEGAVVELGPWLGCSTWHLLEGLKINPGFQSRSLYVYDDFIWRAAWMDTKVEEKDRVPHNEEFRQVFDRYTAAFSDRMTVRQRKICDAEGNQHLLPLDWNDGPIEILYVDCGRTIKVNQAWYDVLSPSFIKDRTLVIMQDWRTFTHLPAHWVNQTKQFTDGLEGQLELVHELTNACLATFLYRGS